MNTRPLTPSGLAADPTALNALRYGAGKGGDKAEVLNFNALIIKENIEFNQVASGGFYMVS